MGNSFQYRFKQPIYIFKLSKMQKGLWYIYIYSDTRFFSTKTLNLLNLLFDFV